MESGQAYDFLTATVHPRPIALVSSMATNGDLNLSPFSFLMVAGSNPPSLAFSPSLSPFGEKDTLTNIRQTGEFVVNLVHREMAEQMNATSKRFPPHISELSEAGFTALPSEKVRPPRVQESMVQLECKLFQVVEHGDGQGAARYVIGEILVAHAASELMPDGKFNPTLWRPIARMGGPNYLDTDALEYFQMVRPT